MARILILHDYRKQFYFATREYAKGIDISRLAAGLTSHSHSVEVLGFEEVDTATSHEGTFVLYQSSEDRGLHYKGYIAGKIMALALQGATLIPQFEFFLSHENKVFFEDLRTQSQVPELTSLWSATFSHFEQLLHTDYARWRYPIVVKSSSGSGSRGVRLANSPKELLAHARALSLVADPLGVAKELGKRALKRGYIPESLFRRPFIVQEYLSNLKEDYKVLAYGNRFFVLARKVRSRDFRASGSGRFTFPTVIPEDILSIAHAVHRHFNVPYISLDIARDGPICHVLEAQFLRFGSYTLEHSPHYYTYDESGHWCQHDWEPDLEATMAQAISDHVERILATRGG